MAAFISEALLQDQECRVPARERGDTQLLGTGGSPHCFRASQALWELPRTRDDIQQPAQGTATAPSIGETPTQAPPAPEHLTQTSPLYSDRILKLWEVCFHRPLDSFLMVFWFFFNLYFVFHSYSLLMHRHQMSALPWMVIYTQVSFKSILTLKITSKCPCKHKSHQPWKTCFTYRCSRQVRKDYIVYLKIHCS